MLPTVAQVLEMDAVRAGEPRVVAGEESLGRLVRWVHAIELPDAARLLRGGELGAGAGGVRGALACDGRAGTHLVGRGGRMAGYHRGGAGGGLGAGHPRV